MIQVWRICARRYARRALLGEGARLWGGRWNPPGMAIVYTAATLSLATLELFVNLEANEFPSDLVSIAAAIPADVEIRSMEAAELPKDWRAYPASGSVQEIGAEWVRKNKTAVLRVPSVVIPAESNYLINPAHPDAAKIRITATKPFEFDPRMWKG